MWQWLTNWNRRRAIRSSLRQKRSERLHWYAHVCSNVVFRCGIYGVSASSGVCAFYYTWRMSPRHGYMRMLGSYGDFPAACRSVQRAMTTRSRRAVLQSQGA